MTTNTDQIIELFERSNIELFNELGGVEAFARSFETDLTNGLPESEKRTNYADRRGKYGENILPDPPKEHWCHMFIECFQDLMLRILIVSAVISLILTCVFPPENKIKAEDFIDTISIFMAVIIVSVVQTQTNYSQQKSFLEINKLKNEFNITVIRQNEETQILNTELLVGDILVVKNGDRVAADALFISGHQLKINNSQETGESQAVSISKEHPFILGGGAVESGDAHCLVAAVGPKSQSGVTMMKIQEIAEEDEQSPLEKKLDKVALMLTYIGLAGALLTFIVLLIFWIVDVVKRTKAEKWQMKWLNELVQHFMVGVTIFICAVPEGLPLAVTLSLGFSMKKMMKDNNFVRHLQACETMGGATTICSDKTGTLTQNKMTVVRFYYDNNDLEQNPAIPDTIRDIFCEAVSINTNAYMTIKEGKTEPEYVGSSSECALLQMLPHYNVDYREVREKNPIVVLHEFNSARKMMSTIIKKEKGHRIYTKGAPDFILRLSNRYMKEDGTVEPLNEDIRKSMLDQITKYADMSLRTMIIAYNDLEGDYSEKWEDAETVENNLVVIAIVGIQDPLRKEVIHAISQCRTANVTVRMVTGDYLNTAKAIARECGILSDDGIALVGADFSKKSKLELMEILPKLQVLARSSPQDKYRLVSLLMESGEVVAVTGDGSNDSAALKKANVGLSMGQCGTELAKMASDIVILDDNFNSIVSALKWGRCVYDNVRGFLQFQLTVNFSAMVIAFIGSCVLKSSPLTTIQLLWVNLIMDSLGALALATFGPTDSLLNRPPYGESDGLISNVLFRNIVGQTTYQLLVLFLILFGAKPVFGLEGKRTISTFVFTSFVYCQVFNLLNSRIAGQDKKFTEGLFTNPSFITIFFGIGALQAIITQIGGKAFQTVPLDWKLWLMSIGFGAGSLVVGAVLRLIKLTDKTTSKLQALRDVRKAEMFEKYRGLTAEQMWTIDYNPEEEKERESDNKKINEMEVDLLSKSALTI